MRERVFVRRVPGAASPEGAEPAVSSDIDEMTAVGSVHAPAGKRVGRPLLGDRGCSLQCGGG